MLRPSIILNQSTPSQDIDINQDILPITTLFKKPLTIINIDQYNIRNRCILSITTFFKKSLTEFDVCQYNICNRCNNH